MCIATQATSPKHHGSIPAKWWVLLMVWSLPALAIDARCRAERDEDARNYCLPMSMRQSIYCQSIQESDSKGLCLAFAKVDKTYCQRVGDQGKQAEW